jgi:hypothetical protein
LVTKARRTPTTFRMTLRTGGTKTSIAVFWV